MIEDAEANPFLSVAFDVFEVDSASPRSLPRTARDWGIPTLADPIDRGIKSYCVRNFVTVHLEHRRHSTGSDLWDSSLVMPRLDPILEGAGLGYRRRRLVLQ